MSANPHGYVLAFGKHKGDLITRVPFDYLRWACNNIDQGKDSFPFFEAEFKRRGGERPDVEITSHAIDRASLRVRKTWHEDRDKDEGLYSWLQRVALEALKGGPDSAQPENRTHKGIKFTFNLDGVWPALLTVVPVKQNLKGSN